MVWKNKKFMVWHFKQCKQKKFAIVAAPAVTIQDTVITQQSAVIVDYTHCQLKMAYQQQYADLQPTSSSKIASKGLNINLHYHLLLIDIVGFDNSSPIHVRKIGQQLYSDKLDSTMQDSCKKIISPWHWLLIELYLWIIVLLCCINLKIDIKDNLVDKSWWLIFSMHHPKQSFLCQCYCCILPISIMNSPCLYHFSYLQALGLTRNAGMLDSL